ncbi:MAG: hypothetical protein ACRD27_03085 [Terracidiphilus sp.]
MNIHEGARRMRRAGRWMMIVPLAVFVLLICVGAASILFRRALLNPLVLIPLFVLLEVPGALLWIAGWILEGFAKDAH